MSDPKIKNGKSSLTSLVGQVSCHLWQNGVLKHPNGKKKLFSDPFLISIIDLSNVVRRLASADSDLLRCALSDNLNVEVFKKVINQKKLKLCFLVSCPNRVAVAVINSVTPVTIVEISGCDCPGFNLDEGEGNVEVEILDDDEDEEEMSE